MIDPQLRVTRRTRSAEWTLVLAAETVASAYATCRPDGRWFVSVDTWDTTAHAPLVDAMAADLRRDLHTIVAADDPATLELWTSLGFREHRRELALTLPTVDVPPPTVPDGVAFVPADDVDETALRQLDDLLRQDVPGTAGWHSDPAEFRDIVFDERTFDPFCFLVAVDRRGQEFAGLVRITMPRPRLGLIGVRREYRGRGLGSALLGAALHAVGDRGVDAVAAEVAEANVPARSMLDRFGARSAGASVVLLRAAG